jgi:hypothetical protein
MPGAKLMMIIEGMGHNPAFGGAYTQIIDAKKENTYEVNVKPIPRHQVLHQLLIRETSLLFQ